MDRSVLNPKADPMGAAIYDYYVNGESGELIVLSSMFDDDIMPVEDLFRGYEDMPGLEQTALQMASGSILDVGAGSGCHSLALKEMGKTVTPIDISPLSVEVMRMRGLDARLVNLYDESLDGRYDTILLLMNGTGIIGCLENMPSFFDRMRQLLNPGGCVLLDSSDLRYLYEEEDGSFMIDLAAGYYGQLDYKMKYGDIEGGGFDWLYVDFDTLSFHAEENGFIAELVQEGEHYDYLARLVPSR